ncbi:MAG: dTDP-4-dehydrorhamnose reductase [Ignavibacteria bacterium]|nr:dTDP-4-dehydrorhamnose reductase [Ignavibacteria bacterium]
MKKILVTGGTGQIGGAIVRLSRDRGFIADAPQRLKFDLCNPQSISSLLANNDYSALINCAAYTSVDKAESEQELAFRINCEAPSVLAKETGRLGIPLIHVSTDYVFDGTKPGPYTENDDVNPLGIYGRSKAEGEAAVRHYNPKHAIVRTAWVVSAGEGNFLDTMLRLAKERDELNIVNDQQGCPSSAIDIASALLHIAANLDGRSGTWHFVNGGEATWHDLARYIFDRMATMGKRTPQLNAISSAEYPTLAKRPQNSRLCTAAFENDFAMTPRNWRLAVDDILSARLK